tara:strand:+ start:77 stop:244 length:168 start_codon:yes stop_codon:yes gene_type:complete
MVTRFLEKRTAEIIMVAVLIMALMSSCGSSKQFHIGTGSELGKSNCSGNYVHGRN